jgi:hypothetical protein
MSYQGDQTGKHAPFVQCPAVPAKLYFLIV